MGLLKRLFGPRHEVQPVHVPDVATFEREVLRADVPVIVDVWSESCAPCRMLAPVLIGVATRYEGRVRVAEISTTAEPGLLSRLNVQATPTVLVFHRGAEKGRVVGYRPGSWFDGMIAKEFPEATVATPD